MLLIPPSRPSLAAVEALLVERLSKLATGPALVDRGARAGRVRWPLVSPQLDRELAEPFWCLLFEAGLLPPGWRDHPARRFRSLAPCPLCEGRGDIYGVDGPCSKCEGRGWRGGAEATCPPTLRACVTFASDPTGVETAERSAEEAARRLRPWDHPLRQYRWSRPLRPSFAGYAPLVDAPAGPTRFVWRTLATDARRVSLARPCAYLNALSVDLVARACRAAGLAFAGLPARSHDFRPEALPAALADARATERSAHAAWRALAARGARVPAHGLSCAAPATFRLLDERFADLDDPFEMLDRIWASGYALERLDGGVAYLAAPDASGARAT